MLRPPAHHYGNADAEAQALLCEAATPDLYERNGFRVLELPVDATSRDIHRRKQMLEMAAGNGVPAPPGPAPCFPLDPPPDEFAVREAVQRLGDPERRLVDEFFWFWPHEQGQSRSDQALQHLAQGRHEEAAQVWTQQEVNRSVGHVSTHNLAVLHHLLALEWEKRVRDNEASPEEQAKIAHLWNHAFRRWQKLLDEEGFWSRLTSRVRELEDPRLTAGSVRRIRAALPAALLSINARLALQAVTKGKNGTAARLVEVIRGSGFPEDAIREGLRQAVEPARNRIKALCRVAEQAAETDPVHADTACEQLLDAALPLLAGLDCLLPEGDPTREVAHDDVAEQALHCQVAFAKKTHQWRRSAQLLERAALVAASASVAKKLQENLAIVRSEAETGNDFCGDGYYDLPSPVLSFMEVARQLAEAGDYDGSIGKLEDLLGGYATGPLQSSHAALVNKALAYCLGGRAVQRVNRAAQGSDEIPPTLEKALFLLQMDSNLFRGLNHAICGACGECLGPQFYTITFRGTQLHVCIGCHAKIQAEDQARKKRLQEAVRLAAQDLVRAGQLDPANKFVQKQIEQIREVCANIGVAFPKTPKARKPFKGRPQPVPGATPETASAAAGKVCSAANWSLGLALAGLWPCGLLAALPAVICGHVALRDIARSGGALAGRGRAQAGLVVGYLALVVHGIALLAVLSGK